MLRQLSCLECIRTDTNSKVLCNIDGFFKTWESSCIWWTIRRLTLISGYTRSVSAVGNRSNSNRIMHTLSLLQKSRTFFSPPPPTWTRILCLRLSSNSNKLDNKYLNKLGPDVKLYQSRNRVWISDLWYPTIMEKKCGADSSMETVVVSKMTIMW